MKKHEFLKKLRSELENEMDGESVKAQLDYYSNYIDDEVDKGRNLSEVLDELGDPWIIARNILDSPRDDNLSNVYSFVEEEKEEEGSHVHSIFVDSWWKKLVFLCVLCLIIFFIGLFVWGAAVISFKYILPFVAIAWGIRKISDWIFR